MVTTKLDDLNKQLTSAEADRIEKESLYQTIVAGSLDQIPEGKTGEALQNPRLREAELKNEYAQASTTYGPNYLKVVELTNRIKAMDDSIQAELKRLEGHIRLQSGESKSCAKPSIRKSLRPTGSTRVRFSTDCSNAKSIPTGNSMTTCRSA